MKNKSNMNKFIFALFAALILIQPEMAWAIEAIGEGVDKVKTQLQAWATGFIIIAIIVWGLIQKFNMFNGRFAWGSGVAIVILSIVILKAESIVTFFA